MKATRWLRVVMTTAITLFVIAGCYYSLPYVQHTITSIDARSGWIRSEEYLFFFKRRETIKPTLLSRYAPSYDPAQANWRTVGKTYWQAPMGIPSPTLCVTPAYSGVPYHIFELASMWEMFHVPVWEQQEQALHFLAILRSAIDDRVCKRYVELLIEEMASKAPEVSPDN
jgi:hypothetical protein